jgi:hypothetical protein
MQNGSVLEKASGSGGPACHKAKSRMDCSIACKLRRT